MTFTDIDAITWMGRIIGLAIVLQTLELFALRGTLTDQGVWSWRIIRREFATFPRPLRALLDFLLDYPRFLGVLGVRILAAAAILVVPHPALMIVLLATTVLVSLRWRGTFNGGSDFMTLIVLMALCVATIAGDNPAVRTGCLWYVSIQTCTSYFVAGWVKLKRRNWRSGRALSGFLRSTIYRPEPFVQRISETPALAFLASWSAMLFECAFPAALLSPALCAGFIAAALFFHLGNAYVFGLNRFLFAWAAAYPALYFCSHLTR